MFSWHYFRMMMIRYKERFYLSIDLNYVIVATDGVQSLLLTSSQFFYVLTTDRGRTANPIIH